MCFQCNFGKFIVSSFKWRTKEYANAATKAGKQEERQGGKQQKIQGMIQAAKEIERNRQKL